MVAELIDWPELVAPQTASPAFNWASCEGVKVSEAFAAAPVAHTTPAVVVALKFDVLVAIIPVEEHPAKPNARAASVPTCFFMVSSPG
jgi:hypothetical protein